ncbi:uncharacterized membrane protein YcaP (DUF421 family) [Rhodopseudomonas julia]|uniref:Uncharacterized membrane protein YcaP (DUF421 family) n=1 Tax=Rhodopseudomonas julia TaxID=200617 RepID=A0ABU0C5D5_9BRAD|nr:YetF domain-containing protein [Rhodopseudomonas julia]MDQ0325116.1 uncharacterized membrane protein YcaP (DUF421 family) [Rhodopseudomonas julia]
MFFDSWGDLFRILIIGILAYGGLVLLLRATGKRTLSKMNAFDFIVTVALGSILATTLLSSDVSLSEGLFAFALLCLLQYAVAYASIRSADFQSLVKADPALLFFRGRFVRPMLKKERVTEEEVYAAMRAAGMAEIEAVAAVVLETDGSISVVPAENEPKGETARASTLQHVQGREDARAEAGLSD